MQLKYSNYVAFSHFHGKAVNNSGLNIKYDILLKSAEICNMIFHTIFLFYITMEKEEK